MIIGASNVTRHYFSFFLLWGTELARQRLCHGSHGGVPGPSPFRASFLSGRLSWFCLDWPQIKSPLPESPEKLGLQA
jgi:hypothetical protein